MDDIFICYRRTDSAPYAGRLHDLLSPRQSSRRLFMDIDAIEPGEDFVEVIEQTLATSRIALVIIGRNWLSETDVDGQRRIDNPDDHVVRELTMALEAGLRVIPVLVGGAAMPTTRQLPDALHRLTRLNAIELSDLRFVADVDRLSATIDRVFERPTTPPAAPQRPKVGKRAATAVAPVASSKATSRRPEAAFLALMKPSPALAAVIGAGPLPRTEVTGKLWDYIKKHDLQDPAAKRFINADAKLKQVFGKPRIDMFEMPRLVSTHLMPVK